MIEPAGVDGLGIGVPELALDEPTVLVLRVGREAAVVGPTLGCVPLVLESVMDRPLGGLEIEPSRLGPVPGASGGDGWPIPGSTDGGTIPVANRATTMPMTTKIGR